MLNDRNHVNTLIDEMFASVLEVSPSCDEDDEIIRDPEIICADERGPLKTTAKDTTTIIINSDTSDRVEYVRQDSPVVSKPHDNKVVISNNLGDDSSASTVSSTEMLPKTVIVIKNGDSNAGDDSHVNGSSTPECNGGSNYNASERTRQVNF